MEMVLSRRARLAIALLVALFIVLAWLGGPASPAEGELLARLAGVRQSEPALLKPAIVLTQLGSIWMTLALPLALSALLLLLGKSRTAFALGGFAILERVVQEASKFLVDRPRPPEADWAVIVDSLSFPSGHSMNSLAMWTAMALLLAPARGRAVVVTLAALFGLSMGLTRPFLGVHYASDVVGGWSLAIILLLMAQGAGLFERRLR